jgi:hypothetical protein
MKRMILASVLMTLLSAATFAGKVVAEGKTFTALGDYTLETSDNQIQMNGEDCKSYIITYENSPMKVTVIVCRDKNCKRYVVISDKLSVQYVCKPEYFGVEKLDKKLASQGLATSDEALNRSEYFHQKVLTPGRRDELEATQLIAAYFPMLLNNQADAVAVK